jgi:PTH1 family peptidyl-tRNA hydrolase
MNVWRRLRRPARRFPPIAWLAIGLGNPGSEYAGTRHSVGHEVVRALASRWECALDQVQHRTRFGYHRIGSDRVCLAVSLTYMNDSGQAVGPLCRAFGLPPDQLLVIADDLDLPLGTLRLRCSGGSGGHRGLASVIRALGTDSFARLRVGIGRPPPGRDPAEYVLAPFGRSERLEADQVVQLAASAVETTLRDGLDAAMNAYNGGTDRRPSADHRGA